MEINVVEAEAAAKRNNKGKPEAQAVDLASMFVTCPVSEVRFKLPAGKIKAFPARNADDLTETTRLAHVLIRLGMTPVRFHASIYQIKTKASGEVIYKLQLPSSGAFTAIKACFVSEDAEAMRAWSDAIVSQGFAPWWKAYKAGKKVETQTATPQSGVKLDIEV